MSEFFSGWNPLCDEIALQSGVSRPVSGTADRDKILSLSAAGAETPRDQWLRTAIASTSRSPQGAAKAATWKADRAGLLG